MTDPLMGDYAGATDLLGQALEQFRALGNRLGEAGALWCLGGVRRLTGDYAGAADLLGEALERFRALGSRLG
ncbi:tetratricopeptide repeat protein, partial [Streptomyces antimycoticus]|uniref:tetratricopeptide repeat protein n=1 Tax=Streptomyces antimycoticus TaxID=68175 RepID=UPI003819FA8C